jgi:hypothetical protein
MTDDKFKKAADAAARLSEIREGKKAPPASVLEVEEEGDVPGETFSTLSADRNQKVMLELRFKTGDASALAYSYLVRADCNPSEGIRLDFSVCEVLLTGRNLRPLFAGIIAQRVTFVQEIDELHAEAMLDSDATAVTRIGVRERE